MGEFKKLFGIDSKDDTEDIISKVSAGLLISLLISLLFGLALLLGILIVSTLGWWVVLLIPSLPILFGIFYWVGNKTLD